VSAEELVAGARGELDPCLDAFVADESDCTVRVFEDKLWKRCQNNVDQENRLQTDLGILFSVA